MQNKIVSFHIITITLLLIIIKIALPYTINSCLEIDRFNTFYKVRECSKSNQRILMRKRTLNVDDCMRYAREKNAFAFNYSPIDLAKDYYNCQLLPCPELTNSFVNDTQYDYYTIYANSNGR